MSWEFDVMRFLVSTMAGALLSFGGSIVQLTTKNELATPSTLGMDGLAVAMVMLAYFLESQGLSFIAPELMAFLLGVILLLVLTKAPLVRFFAAGDTRTILLLGLSINLLVGAGFAVMQFLSMAFNQEFPTELWFGRMRDLDTAHWFISLGVLSCLGAFSFKYRRAWKTLLLGSGWSRGLGVPVDKIIQRALLLAFLATLWVITQFGVFSFMGLLFPLLLRQLPRYRGQPWKEMTDGALFSGLVFATLDHFCFNFTFHGAEIPVGLPSALFGAAALVALLWYRRSSQFVGKKG